MKADLFMVKQKFLGKKQKVQFFALLRSILQMGLLLV